MVTFGATVIATKLALSCILEYRVLVHRSNFLKDLEALLTFLLI